MHNKRSYKTKRRRSYRKKNNTRLKVVSIISVPVFLLGAGFACKRADAKFDHTQALCFFAENCEKLGLDIGWKHQIKKIQESGLNAYHQNEKLSRTYRHSIELVIQDGNYIRREKMIPEGFEKLEKNHDGYDCYKEEYQPESIVIEEKNGTTRKLQLK